MKKQYKIILLSTFLLPLILIGYFWRGLITKVSVIDSLSSKFYLLVLIVLVLLPFVSFGILSWGIKSKWFRFSLITVCLALFLLLFFNIPYFLNLGITIEPAGLTDNAISDSKYNYRIKYPLNLNYKLYSEFERDVFYSSWYDKAVERHIHFDVPGYRGFDIYVFKGQISPSYAYKVTDTRLSSGLFRYSHEYQLANGYILELVRYFVEDQKYADQIQFFKDFGKNNISVFNAAENILKADLPVFVAELTNPQFNLATSTLVIAKTDPDKNNSVQGAYLLAYRNSKAEWVVLQDRDYYLPKNDFVNLNIEQLKSKRAFNKVLGKKDLPQGLKLADLKKAYPISDDPVYITTDGESIHLLLKFDKSKEENYLYSVNAGEIKLIGYFENNLEK